MRAPLSDEQQAAVMRFAQAYEAHKAARSVNPSGYANRKTQRALHAAAYEAKRAGVTAAFLGQMVGVSRERMRIIIQRHLWDRANEAQTRRLDARVERRQP